MPEINKHIIAITEWPKKETSYELAGKLLTSQREHADSVMEVIEEALNTVDDNNAEPWRFALALCENQKEHLEHPLTKLDFQDRKRRDIIHVEYTARNVVLFFGNIF